GHVGHVPGGRPPCRRSACASRIPLRCRMPHRLWLLLVRLDPEPLLVPSSLVPPSCWGDCFSAGGREKLYVGCSEAEFHGLVEFKRPVTREYGCHRRAFTQVEADHCFGAHALDNTDTTVECAARLVASFRKNRLRSQAH